MLLEEYFQRDTEMAARQSQIADAIGKMAMAKTAHSNNLRFVDLVNQQIRISNERAKMAEEMLKEI